MWVHHQKILRRSKNPISMYPMYVWMFICVHMYPIFTYQCLYLFISTSYLFKSGKKWNQNQNYRSMANMKSKLMDKIMRLQSMSNLGEMHLPNNLVDSFCLNFIQGQLCCDFFSGTLSLAHHCTALYDECKSEMPEISCQTEFRHYSFYDVKKVRTVTPRHL